MRFVPLYEKTERERTETHFFHRPCAAAGGNLVPSAAGLESVMAKETLPIRVLWVWRGAAVLTAVVFTLLTVLIFRPTLYVYLFFAAHHLGALRLCRRGLPAGVYRSYYFELGPEQLHIHRGVLFVREQWLDRSKILLVSLYHNPLTPVLHLSSLMLTTPGAHCLLVSLDTGRAKQLASRLSRHRKGGGAP